MTSHCCPLPRLAALPSQTARSSTVSALGVTLCSVISLTGVLERAGQLVASLDHRLTILVERVQVQLHSTHFTPQVFYFQRKGTLFAALGCGVRKGMGSVNVEEALLGTFHSLCRQKLSEKALYSKSESKPET